MPPLFETIKSFADVKCTDEGVDTVEFLEASDGLVKMFDLLGSQIFGFVQADIKNNIAGVRDRYNARQENSRTLQKLVEYEVEETRPTNQHSHGRACLVRLLRGLFFTCEALMNMQRDTSAELHVCFRRSYDKVLKHHHSFVVRTAVSVAIRAVPRRPDFYARISQGGDVQKLDVELAKWLAGLDSVVRRMKVWIEEEGHGHV